MPSWVQIYNPNISEQEYSELNYLDFYFYEVI